MQYVWRKEKSTSLRIATDTKYLKEYCEFGNQTATNLIQNFLLWRNAKYFSSNDPVQAFYQTRICNFRRRGLVSARRISPVVAFASESCQ